MTITMTLTEFVDVLENDLAKIDELIAEFNARAPQPISCTSCTSAAPGCCHMKVIAWFAEALPIVRHLKQAGLDSPEFRSWLKDEGEEMEGTARDTWFRQARPCVFLRDGRCSIYSRRPLACRTHFAVSPAEWCQPGDPNGEARGVMGIDFTPLNASWVSSIGSAHAALQIADTPKRLHAGTLPRMVLIGLEAWDAPDFQRHIQKQVWPSFRDTSESRWVEGKNPFGQRLVQIRRRQAASP